MLDESQLVIMLAFVTWLFAAVMCGAQLLNETKKKD